jgi:hypothetical protein
LLVFEEENFFVIFVGVMFLILGCKVVSV